MTSRKEGAHEAGLCSSLCAHIQTNCEAVEIDLLDFLIAKWNVTPRIWQASNYYFFTDLYCSRIAQNTRFAARRRREARKGYFAQ